MGHGSPRFSFQEILSAIGWGDDVWDGVAEQIQENMGDVHYDLEDNVEYDPDYEVKSGRVESYVLADSSLGIIRLQVQAGGCSMEIQVSEDDCFRVEAEGMRKFQGYVEDNTLVICGTSKAGSDDQGNLGGSICLYVPEGYYFENTSLDVGAGSLNVEELQTGSLEANVGAGQLTVEELNSRVTEVSVGMGSVHLTGDVTESLNADCSMGELKLTLAGEQNDFNYDLSCGMGVMKVGSDSYNGMAQEKQIDNHADKNMQLECAMGSVKVEFL